jgi:hypothetical protein
MLTWMLGRSSRGAKSHVVRWAGFFAPNSPYRKEIIIKPQVKKGFQFNTATLTRYTVA